MITIPIQIRFSDLDMLGHVNNVNLQHYLDQGKCIYFRDVVGMDITWRDGAFSTAATSTSYFNEVRLDDNIEVTTKITKIGTKSITFLQEIVECDTKVVKCQSISVLVAFDTTERKSVVIRDTWREKIVAYESDIEFK